MNHHRILSRFSVLVLIIVCVLGLTVTLTLVLSVDQTEAAVERFAGVADYGANYSKEQLMAIRVDDQSPKVIATGVNSYDADAVLQLDCPCSIWDLATTPSIASFDDPHAYELGVKFQSVADGYITGIRFYKGISNTGTHIGNLWTSAGALLATATFSNETASGWQQVNFDQAVPIISNTTYVASYHTTVGYYAADSLYFSAGGVNNPPLLALADGIEGGNGVFRFGATSGFPSDSFNATNYWVDVVFDECYALSTSVNPSGSGVVSSDPTPNCADTLYLPGTTVTLTATADPGWTFSGWSGDASGSSNPLPVTIDGNKDITATFTQDEYMLDVTIVGGGGVTKNPATGPYYYDDVVTLTATADPGWTFSGWSEDASGSSNPLLVTMDGNKDITATFTQIEYTLDVTVVGGGGVTKNPATGPYYYDDVVTLTATADPGWTFSGWSERCIGQQQSAAGDDGRQ